MCKGSRYGGILSCSGRLNYDKYFKDGDTGRNTLSEFNSNNTQLLDVEEVKAKLIKLQYIRNEMDAAGLKY